MAFGDSATGGARSLRAVTKHDTNVNWTDQDNASGRYKVTKAIYVGTQGDLTVLAENDVNPVTIPDAIGEVNIRVLRVMATGTDASGIVAYF